MQKDMQLSEALEAERNCRDTNDSENKKTVKQPTGFTGKYDGPTGFVQP